MIDETKICDACGDKIGGKAVELRKNPHLETRSPKSLGNKVARREEDIDNETERKYGTDWTPIRNGWPVRLQWEHTFHFHRDCLNGGNE